VGRMVEKWASGLQIRQPPAAPPRCWAVRRPRRLDGRPPGLRHAQADLREARWQLGHRAVDVAVSRDEAQALDENARTIHDVERER